MLPSVLDHTPLTTRTYLLPKILEDHYLIQVPVPRIPNYRDVKLNVHSNVRSTKPDRTTFRQSKTEVLHNDRTNKYKDAHATKYT